MLRLSLVTTDGEREEGTNGEGRTLRIVSGASMYVRTRPCAYVRGFAHLGSSVLRF